MGEKNVEKKIILGCSMYCSEKRGLPNMVIRRPTSPKGQAFLWDHRNKVLIYSVSRKNRENESKKDIAIWLKLILVVPWKN